MSCKRMGGRGRQRVTPRVKLRANLPHAPRRRAPLNGSRVGEIVLMQRAVARRLLLTHRWKHVVVHADHHRHKHYGVIEKVEFNPGNYQLQNTYRDRLSPKNVMHWG